MVTRQPLLLQVSYLQVTRNIIHSLRLGTKSSKEDIGRNGDGESRGKKIQWVGIKQSLPQPRSSIARIYAHLYSKLYTTSHLLN